MGPPLQGKQTGLSNFLVNTFKLYADFVEEQFLPVYEFYREMLGRAGT